MLEKYKNDFVEIAQKVNKTLIELSERSESFATVSMLEVETAEQADLKKKLSYNSTYSIFDLVKRYLTKFQSNKVVREFNIGGADNKDFTEYLEKINYSKTVKEITSKEFNEPNDFILIEKEKDKPVINLIPINSVYYYDDITLIYELAISTKEERVYRKIEYTTYKSIEGWWDFIIRQKVAAEGKEDYISQRSGEAPQVYGFNEQVLLTECPFSQVGKLIYKDQVKDTFIFTVVEKMKIYKRDSDIFETSYVQHAFPEKITIAFDCLKCNGTGKVDNGPNGSYECDACNGTGKYWVRNPSEVLKIPQLISNEMKPYMDEIVKYVEKDIKTLDFQQKTLKQLEEEITFHATGLKNVAVSSMKTATEVQENQIPLNSRINDLIKIIQEIETWMLTVMGKLFTDKFKSVIVKYQLFYVGRTEEDILKSIKEGKDLGLNLSFLRSQFIDWIHAYYRNEPVKLQEQLKLANVEPYPFYTLTELRENQIMLDAEQLTIKIELQNYIGYLDLTREPEEIKQELLKKIAVLTKIKEDESIDRTQS